MSFRTNSSAYLPPYRTRVPSQNPFFSNGYQHCRFDSKLILQRTIMCWLMLHTGPWNTGFCDEIRKFNGVHVVFFFSTKYMSTHIVLRSVYRLFNHHVHVLYSCVIVFNVYLYACVFFLIFECSWILCSLITHGIVWMLRTLHARCCMTAAFYFTRFSVVLTDVFEKLCDCFSIYRCNNTDSYSLWTINNTSRRFQSELIDNTCTRTVKE